MRVVFSEEVKRLSAIVDPYIVYNGLKAEVRKDAPNYDYLVSVFEKNKELIHKEMEEARKLCW